MTAKIFRGSKNSKKLKGQKDILRLVLSQNLKLMTPFRNQFYIILGNIEKFCQFFVCFLGNCKTAMKKIYLTLWPQFHRARAHTQIQCGLCIKTNLDRKKSQKNCAALWVPSEVKIQPKVSKIDPFRVNEVTLVVQMDIITCFSM